MRLRWLAFAALLVACADVAPPAAAPAGDIPADDGRRPRAQLVVHYPTGWGHRIAVRGSAGGLTWSAGRDLTWTTGDAWTGTFALAATIELKPLFDDTTWSLGPNYVLAPGGTLDVWPHFFHDGGRLVEIAGFSSSRLGDTRRVTVYLPPSYDETPARRYAVVYMHDGQNLFHGDEAFAGVSWDVAGAMDGGAADAEIAEAIVVGIDNDGDRIWEYTPTDGGYGGGGADAYLGFVADELKPAIDERFHTRPDREHTAIVGSSLGGLVSIYAGIARPETFGVVGALSPSTWWDGTWIIAKVAAAGTLPVRVYVDSGDDDRANTAHLADTFRGRGADLDYVVDPGAQHGEYWWRKRLPGAMAFLLGGY